MNKKISKPFWILQIVFEFLIFHFLSAIRHANMPYAHSMIWIHKQSDLIDMAHFFALHFRFINLSFIRMVFDMFPIFFFFARQQSFSHIHRFWLGFQFFFLLLLIFIAPCLPTPSSISAFLSPTCLPLSPSYSSFLSIFFSFFQSAFSRLLPHHFLFSRACSLFIEMNLSLIRIANSK